LPADLLASGAAAHPPTGLSDDAGPHSFLTRFAAHPIDYFTGDLALGWDDWNFVRSDLTREVLATLGESNPHERANGIRWTVWILVVAALFHWPKGGHRLKTSILAFGAFAFWLSLAPTWPEFSPSYWLYSLVSQVRVPSRAGIYVHFAVLLFAGLFIRNYCAGKGFRRYLPWALPLLIVAELPPFAQDMKIANVRPRLESLASENCGTGMYFPYVSGNWGVLQNYYFLQEMRGTACGIVNHQWPDPGSEKMFRAMGLSPAIFNAFNSGRPESIAAVIKVAECAPLSFLVFDPGTARAAREGLCARLGWQMSEERVCKRPGLAMIKNPSECL
jgi:hypothetical protein